jgi:hypothetical protein
VEVKKKLVQHEQEAVEMARLQHQKEVSIQAPKAFAEDASLAIRGRRKCEGHGCSEQSEKC